MSNLENLDITDQKSFVDAVKKWVEYDNKIQSVNEKMKKIRQDREKLSSNITSYMKNNSMEQTVINIKDGQLKYQEYNTAQPLTYKFLKDCLSDFLGDNEKSSKIIDYIKNKREYKKTTNIKRHINKPDN
tara:strand:- start:1888 stop:2277 length:390 start_codon:yes stop_codon:yes gene_type:complete